MKDLNDVLSDGFLDVQPDGLMRFSLWYENAGISRSMAYDLQKTLQIVPEMRRVQGSKRPAAFLTQEHQHLMNSCVQLIKNGHSLPEIRDRVANHLANSQKTEPKSSELTKSKPSEIVPTQQAEEALVGGTPQADGQMLALATAIATAIRSDEATGTDPLTRARRLREMDREGLLLTGPELSKVLGMEIDAGLHGQERFGYTFTREPSSGKNKWMWSCYRNAGHGASALSADSKSFIPMGGEPMAARQMFDVTFIDCTGSSLMAQNRIG